LLDNTPDDNVGLDDSSMDDIALILANTKRDIRETVENVLGWEFTSEMLCEVLKRVHRCACGMWLPVRLDSALCPECADKMTNKHTSSICTVADADVEWLQSIGVTITNI
jgi:hypothetical protein